ncbi:Alpha-L-arabinofuranosidase 1 [Triticum urartu]|uniref:non-reducing end alpha-L-arabinofuranosidase n=1 Tax=Triticum urartu TaxID=4572 RepID=M7YUB1_TRIUA|nr:Alpha-L-arabinofuranosidase 1 [Triticum urartu]
MTETNVPKVDASGEGGWTGGGGGGGMHRVELVGAITSVEYHPCTGVLHRKANIIKFDSNMILTSKATNRYKVLGDGGEEPPDERSVDRGPLGVAYHGVRVDGAVNMIHEIVLAEEERKIRLPREVRGVGGIEDYGDAFMDVDVADVGGVWPSEGVGVGGGVGGHGGDTNIEEAKVYKVSMYIRSSDSMDLTVSLTSSDGLQNLAAYTITADKEDFKEWAKVEFDLQSSERNSNSRLQLTTRTSGIVWFDQVSLMPSDTYMGHGYRKDLASMLANLKPKFLKFPGGNYVMGNYLLNAFRWSETVGPWEERPGHFNDVWGYWTDDGLGFFEFLQLAEDLGACPVWVVNDGASRNEQVPSATIAAFVKDVVDGIEFARGDPGTSWGSVRAAMGHPEPFQLNYISMGNQECSMHYYKENYRKFYSAIKASYPDIKIISSCDRSTISPVEPADLYDVHVYTSSGDMFSKSSMFDSTPRGGPKAIVSEYAVTGNDAGRGTLVAALAEAAFLIGLERNSDAVEMASCAPLFVNDNDRRWSPDAIVFNSWQHYGCPNYWMLHFFKESSGAALHPSTIQVSNYNQLVASAITWQNSKDGNTYLKIKVLNFGNKAVDLSISITGLENEIQTFGSIKTVLTSGSLRDENSFQQPDKVVPVESPISNAREEMSLVLDPYSLTSFDLLLDPSNSTMMHSVPESSLHSSM